MADPSKVSTPEEITEAMEAYRRQTGHYPPAVMLHPDTLRALNNTATAVAMGEPYGSIVLLAHDYLPLGMLVFCERDGTIPQAKPKPYLSFGDADLFVKSSLGVEMSLGKVTNFAMNFRRDPLEDVLEDILEDILKIPTYQRASAEEIARRLTDEFGV